MNFKLKYPQFSFCFRKKCTVETLNIFSHRYANYMHHGQVSFCYDETTKWQEMTKFLFIYFLRQLIISSPRENNFPASWLCKSSSYLLERSFHFSSCSNAIFAFQSFSLVSCTFSRNSVVHKNFSCWIYFSSKVFAWYIFSEVHLETIWFQNSNCQWGKNVTGRNNFSKLSWKTEQVSCLSK